MQIWDETRKKLRAALADLIPGEEVILFGSITHRGVFNDASDIDLALQREPKSLSSGLLMVELMERLERSVDVVLLSECRLQAKILAEGERWTI